MKNFIFIFYLICSSYLLGQHEIADTDTTLNYRSVFYKNSILDLNQHYVYVDTNANEYFDYTKYVYHDSIDTTGMIRKPQGKWKVDYQIKRKKYYYLVEYEGGSFIGKRYAFTNKGNLVKTYARYPKIKDSTFKGIQIISYDKNQNIISIEYVKFNEDESNLFYWNRLYFKMGVLQSYYFDDEEFNDSKTIKYFDGQIIKESVRNKYEWYEKEWSKNGYLLKEISYMDKEWTTRYYRDGVLFKEKTGRH